MAKKYPEIKSFIADKIGSGEYKVGEMLPSEKFFTELFNVSRMTIRRAFDELIQDGILIRKSGSGVFVAPEKITRKYTKLSIHSDEDILKTYDHLSTKVIGFSVLHDSFLIKKYLKLNEDCFQVTRVQYGNDEPFLYENLILPCRFFPNLTKEECYKPFKYIVLDSKLKDAKEKDNIKFKLTIEAYSASEKISKQLQVSTNHPILQVNALATVDGEPVYFTFDSYDGNKFSWVSE